MELPQVAHSVYLPCKKCDVERYHKVIAHTSTDSAKVQCEVCGRKGTYKLPKQKNLSLGSDGKGVGAGVGEVKAKRASTVSAASRKAQYESEYLALKEKYSNAKIEAYNMRTQFAAEQVLQHPKFGVGFVRQVMGDKIEVVFSDEVRPMVHNRK